MYQREYYLWKISISRYVEGGIPPPDSYVHILGLHEFCDTELNFHHYYLATDWGMCTVAFSGVGVLLIANITVYGMIKRLQHYYSEHRDDLFEILGIDLNWIMNLLSDRHRRA